MKGKCVPCQVASCTRCDGSAKSCQECGPPTEMQPEPVKLKGNPVCLEWPQYPALHA